MMCRFLCVFMFLFFVGCVSTPEIQYSMDVTVYHPEEGIEWEEASFHRTLDDCIRAIDAVRSTLDFIATCSAVQSAVNQSLGYFDNVDFADFEGGRDISELVPLDYDHVEDQVRSF